MKNGIILFSVIIQILLFTEPHETAIVSVQEDVTIDDYECGKDNTGDQMEPTLHDFRDDSPIVRVGEGLLRGKLGTSPNGKVFKLFQGIPYAQPPVGPLRFKAPQPLQPWKGILNATKEGNSSIQFDDFFIQDYLGDEDCLYLNIYTPDIDCKLRPVMIFIYGGHYRFGYGSAYLYGGHYLVEKDVVVVTINFRTGALGFLSLNTPEVPGNAALKDVFQALLWIKKNIKKFGGDPENLTVFGESSGASVVSLLTASPLTQNLISKAILQSGTALCTWAFQNNPLESVRYLGWKLGLDASDVNEIYEHLLTVPALEIVKATHEMNPIDVVTYGKTIFGPVIETDYPGVEAFLTEPFVDALKSGRVAKIPVMIGSNGLEFTFETNDDVQLYIPTDLNIPYNSTDSMKITENIKKLYFENNDVGSAIEKYQLISDFMMTIGPQRHTRYLADIKYGPIYYYKFRYVGGLNLAQKFIKSFSLNHAGHMDELGYLFTNEYLNIKPSPRDIVARERMVRLWTNFARTGNPTPDDDCYLNVTWLPVTKTELNYLSINDELTMAKNPDPKKMEFWEELYRKYFDEKTSVSTDIPTRELVIIDTKQLTPNYKITDHQYVVLVNKRDRLNFALKLMPAV